MPRPHSRDSAQDGADADPGSDTNAYSAAPSAAARWMMEAAFWLSVLCGVVVGLCMGLRSAAWPLVASAIAGEWLRHYGLTGDWLFAIHIDLLTALFIVRRNMRWVEWAIVGLFPLAWAFYATQWAYLVSSAVVIVQLFLTIFLPKRQSIPGAVSHGPLRPIFGGIQNEGA